MAVSIRRGLWAASLSALTSVLVGCGGDSDTTGMLVGTTAATSSLTTAQFQAASPTFFAVAGTPKCDVNFHSYTFTTRGAVGEFVKSTAGLIVPTGTDPACTGPRPVLLYAHGTSFDKNFNMAQATNSEAALVAAMFAAQGYIVVAPNYAGYGASTLSYHPYLIMNQQAGEMMDAWNAIKTAWPNNASSNGKLFVTGYSQGGYVAMATQRALQIAGVTVTASGPMSGPYALGRFGDAIFGGYVNAGATLFGPMLFSAAQKTYGNLYTNTSDLYEAAYATGIETLLPNTTPYTTLIANSKLPATNFFSATSQPQPAGTFGFGTGNLIKDSYRQAVLADVVAKPNAPSHPLRVAAYKNDLLLQNWTPNRPTLLCGGNADPMVFYATNTTAAATDFANKGAGNLITVLDVDSASTGASDPFAAVKTGFAAAKTAAGANALAQYHGELVPPFCQVAVRAYFSQF